MIRGFRVIGRAGTAMAMTVGLVVATAAGASALTMPEGDAPQVTSAPSTDSVPALPALPVGGALGTPPDAVAGLLGTGLGILAPSSALPSGNPPFGDGLWSPSHDEELAIIPICSGPGATLDWLVANFSDHGSDLGLYLRTHGARIGQLVAGSADPEQTLQYLMEPVLQILVYAINDTRFHIPPTLGDILSLCASARS